MEILRKLNDIKDERLQQSQENPKTPGINNDSSPQSNKDYGQVNMAEMKINLEVQEDDSESSHDHDHNEGHESFTFDDIKLEDVQIVE